MSINNCYCQIDLFYITTNPYHCKVKVKQSKDLDLLIN